MADNLYFDLYNTAEDINEVLKDLIKTKKDDKVGRVIGIIEENVSTKSIGTLDNVITETNIALSPILKNIKDATTSSELTLEHLPENGCMYRVVDDDGLKIISKIKIKDIKNMECFDEGVSDTRETTHDYYCTFIFKKEASIDEPIELMDNLEEDDNRDGDLPSIKLLNPELDISEFSVIHLLLFNDSENICAIFNGY